MTVYTPSVGNLKLKPEHIFKAMGYKKDRQPDEYTIQSAGLLLEEISSRISPVIYLETFEGFCENDTLTINDKVFHPGEEILEHLQGITRFHTFIATLGQEFEEWKREPEKQDNPLLLYVMDALGSCAVERCTIAIQHLIRSELPDNWGTTSHFSPGYCHWDVAEQQQLFSLFPCGFNAVTLTESSLMIPVKSVSGIIGTGKNVTARNSSCQICLKKDCFRRIS